MSKPSHTTPQKKWVIRAAVESDAPEILDLIRGLAEFEKLAHEVIADEAKLRATLFGPRPAAEVWIAEVDGTAAGFALFFTSYSTFLAQPGIYLEDLFVRPAFRNQGLGLALLRRLAALVIERGGERGGGRLEWSVLDWNVDALRFYARLGARPMSDWTVQRLTGATLRQLADENS